MSESVLQILLRLFAIIAREDGLEASEREVVRVFLDEHLPSSEVQRYMELFEKYSSETVTQSAGEFCREATNQLSRKQQLILLLHLLDLVYADGVLSERELGHIDAVVGALTIESGWVEALKNFAWAGSAEEIHGAGTLRIDGGVGKEGQKHLAVPVPGTLMVLSLGNGLLYLVKYFGDAYLQLNHQYLPPRRNLVLRHGSVITLPHGRPVYFSDISRNYLPLKVEEQIRLRCEGVEYRFPKGNQGLHPIHVEESSGRLVAIMGASGSGKSTLLNVLNGNLRPSKGKVTLNGQDLHASLGEIKGLIGYVPQDDLLIEDLSVYQNLYFNARLCHKDLDHDELDALVMKVLTDLGLTETRDLRVGNPLEKTISGGQRKRLNIGLELLRAPAVIFFDEPTSGLSSRDSENIMDLLKELTFKGKLVFVVIHQPSSDIFKMFDSLLVLDTGGYPIYYGNPVEAVVYFRRMSEQVNQQSAACETCGNINPEQIFNIVEARVIDEYGQVTNQRKTAPAKWYEVYLKHHPVSQAGGGASGALPSAGLKTPAWLRQVGVFLRRDLLAKVGNRQYLAINLLQAPLLALILAVLVRYSEPVAGVEDYFFGKNENIPAFFFMSIVVALFVGMTMSAEEIFRDRKILKRESFLSLSRSGYLLSKTGILFGFSAVQMVGFVVVGALVLNLPGLYLSYWLMLFSLGCFAIMLGLNISATFNSAVTIYILIPLMLIPQLILSGTVVRFDRLNPGFSSPKMVPLAADLMASRWAYEGLMVRYFKDNAYQAHFFQDAAQASEAVYFKDYWVPQMSSLVNFCARHNGAEGQDSVGKMHRRRVKLLAREFEDQMGRLPKVDLPCKDSLAAGQYSASVAACANAYLDRVKQAYVGQYGRAKQGMDKAQASLGATFSNGLGYSQFQYAHHNESIDKLARNSDSGTRLLEEDDALVRTFEPVYLRPQAANLLDYRSHFYAPEKHFLGGRWDTFAFNVGVIWGMTALLFVTLYFEVFRKLLGWFSGRGKR